MAQKIAVNHSQHTERMTIMSTDDTQKNLRVAIDQHFTDAARLFQQLPENEHDNYLNTALCAWEDVATKFLTPEKFQIMIETLMTGEENLRTNVPPSRTN